jgi:hypothetical protein|tara:strand:- start:1216 stop:1500 length:285 start_codon:yes stop_codon:yes gene_type:complete
MPTQTKPQITYYHITKPHQIKWQRVTKEQFQDAQLMTADKTRQYSDCLLFSCINPTPYKRRYYIQFKGMFFTAQISLGTKFIDVVKQLDTESKY